LILPDGLESDLLKHRFGAEGGIHVNPGEVEGEAGIDRMPHQGSHDPSSFVFWVDIGAIDMAIGIEFKKTRNLRAGDRHEGPLAFTAVFPVVIIHLAIRPGKALLF